MPALRLSAILRGSIRQSSSSVFSFSFSSSAVRSATTPSRLVEYLDDGRVGGWVGELREGESERREGEEERDAIVDSRGVHVCAPWGGCQHVC